MFSCRSLTAFLAAGLLLGTLGCTKKEEVPEPALEGTWDYTRVVTTSYDAAGAQSAQTTRLYPQDNTRAARYLTITSTTMQFFFGDGTPSSSLNAYTRSGNTLIVNPAIPTDAITQLTATELTLFTNRQGTQQGNYNNYETHYTRR